MGAYQHFRITHLRGHKYEFNCTSLIFMHISYQLYYKKILIHLIEM